MIEWYNICKILKEATDSGCNAVIPAQDVPEFYYTIQKKAINAQSKICKKVLKNIQDVGGNSVWAVSLGVDLIKVRIRGCADMSELKALYEYLEKYYRYTEDLSAESENLIINLRVKGSEIRVTFDSYAYTGVSEDQRTNVRMWSRHTSVGKSICSDSDIIVWNMFYQATGVIPFLVGLSDVIF